MSLALGAWSFFLTRQVATLSATITSNAIAHRHALMRAVSEAKAKARIRRLIAAIPLVGIGTLAYFEEQDYREWLEDNPEGTLNEYTCELSAISATLIDEVLQELPEEVRPNPEMSQSLLDRYSACTTEQN